MTYTFKILITIIISVLLLSNITAQNNNSFGGVRFGYALPMGQFASHEYGTGGYALLGKSIGLEGAWFISPKIGFGVDISSSTFGFATGYYAEDMKENTPEFESSVDMLSGPYSVKTVMGGLYYRVSFTPKFYSTFKLMGGLFSARTPDQFHGVIVYIQGKTYWWKTGSLERTFGMLTGASFEYQIYGHVNLLLQADFTYAEPAFVFDTGLELYTEKMKMPVFKLLPGINIRF
jgi:hypothetical protein